MRRGERVEGAMKAQDWDIIHILTWLVGNCSGTDVAGYFFGNIAEVRREPLFCRV